MTRTRTSRTALAAAALLAAGLPVLIAPQAQAIDPPGTTELALVEVGRAGATGVDVFATPSGPRTPYAGFDVNGPQRFLRSLEVSRGGDRTVTVEPAGGVDRIVVRDISGAVVGVPVVGTAQAPTIYGAHLSPDGTRVYWSQGINNDGFPSQVVLRSAAVTGAGTSTVVRDRIVRDVIDQDRLLVTSSDIINPALSVLDLSSGALTPVTAVGRNVLDIEALSPDLTQALTRVSGPDRTLLLQISPVTLVGDALTLGPARTLVSLADNGSPFNGQGTFSRDGLEVWYVGSTPEGLFRVPVLGGSPTPFGAAVDPDTVQLDVRSATREQQAPAALTSVGPALLRGTSAVIPYAAAADPTASRVVVTRTSPGEATVQRQAVVPEPLIDSDLVIGKTYTYAVQQVDRSGNTSPTTSFTLTATAAPALTFADPTSRTSTNPSFVVRFAAPGNATSTLYTVGAQVIGGTAQRWATATTSPARLFGHPGAPPVIASTTSTPGTTYGFRGVAQDQFGNNTDITTSARAVVPIDQRGLTTRESTAQLTRPGAYGGSTVFLRRAGADINARVTGDRFQVIGERSATTGAFDVYLSGQRLARVDTRGARGVRQVLWSANFPTSRTGVLTVRAVGTPGRPTVVVDAISQRARP